MSGRNPVKRNFVSIMNGYTPKNSTKDCNQIARKMLSVDDDEDRKWSLNPVKYEWKPDSDLVILHFDFDTTEEDEFLPKGQEPSTWTMTVPLRPFEVGYKIWHKENITRSEDV